jgi:hypothetical protein
VCKLNNLHIKQLFLITGVLFCFLFSYGQTSDLIISEYIEGSSNNKYLEIYNGTGSAINLSDYEVQIFSNGATTPSSTISLSSTLANGNVYVIANSSATAWSGIPDLSTGSLNFNGDDAVALYKISTSSFVDIFGNIGCDPGSAWSGGGNSTQNKTLIRNATVCSGVTTDSPLNCPFPTLGTEWTQLNQDDVSNLGTHTANCSCSPLSEPTVNASNVSVTNIQCYQAEIAWTNGNGNNRIAVISVNPISGLPSDQTAYNANNNFGSGSTISAGEYVVFNGSGNTVTVLGLSSNTTYYVAVFEYNGTTPNCDENYMTTSITTSFTTSNNCLCPEIKSILVNACTTAEGTDEYIIYQNGNFDTYVDSLIVTFHSAGTWCNNGCGANTFVNNQTYLNQLNTLAGCPGLFVYSDTIPANAQVIIFTGNPPSYTMDFSSQCGAGPFYAVFCNNTSTSGRFANSSNDFRNTSIQFSSTCTDAVSYYSSSANTGTDGDYVDFDAAGNPYYKNNPLCAVPLPVTYLYFNGEIISNNLILLDWATVTEINNDYFAIEHSTNGNEFTNLGVVYGNGNSTTERKYSFYADVNTNIPNYFRLKQVDFNGKYEYSDIIVVNKTGLVSKIYFDYFNKMLHFISPDNKVKNVSIYDISGKLVYNKVNHIKNTLSLQNLENGIYFVNIYMDNKLYREKIIVK